MLLAIKAFEKAFGFLLQGQVLLMCSENEHIRA